jgi:hypothetical protein
MTIRPSVKWGAAIGSCGTIVALVHFVNALHSGVNMNGFGLGQSISLFVLCLPWSIAVWIVMLGTVILTGEHGAAFNASFFFCMPIVAGAGWGWVIGELRRRFRWTAADKTSS